MSDEKKSELGDKEIENVTGGTTSNAGNAGFEKTSKRGNLETDTGGSSVKPIEGETGGTGSIGGQVKP